MLYTKLALLSCILATWAAAFWDGSLPYFPIEISRTATGKLSKNVFRYGVLLCTVVLFAESTSRVDYLAWTGLIILSHFDDVTNLLWHQIGVAVMALGVLAKALIADNLYHSLLLFLAGATFYTLRLLIKVGVLVVLEFERPLNADTTVGLLWNVQGFRDKLLQQAYAIMFKGESRAKHPKASIYLFSLCGILQWIVFFLFSFIF